MKHPTLRDILGTLARTLSVTATLKALPGLTDRELRRQLQAAADACAAARTGAARSVANEKLVAVYCDGASRGNPGPSAIGVVIKPVDADEIVVSETIGTCTNNQAEYRAVIRALEVCREAGFARLQIFLDTQLIANQLTGQYRVRDRKLQQLYREADALRSQFAVCRISNIPRAENRDADRAANRALDLAE